MSGAAVKSGESAFADLKFEEWAWLHQRRDQQRDVVKISVNLQDRSITLQAHRHR